MQIRNSSRIGRMHIGEALGADCNRRQEGRCSEKEDSSLFVFQQDDDVCGST